MNNRKTAKKKEKKENKIRNSIHTYDQIIRVKSDQECSNKKVWKLEEN